MNTKCRKYHKGKKEKRKSNKERKILAELIKNPPTLIPTSGMGFPTTVWFKR
jgi:hypothetical protein